MEGAFCASYFFDLRWLVLSPLQSGGLGELLSSEVVCGFALVCSLARTRRLYDCGGLINYVVCRSLALLCCMQLRCVDLCLVAFMRVEFRVSLPTCARRFGHGCDHACAFICAYVCTCCLHTFAYIHVTMLQGTHRCWYCVTRVSCCRRARRVPLVHRMGVKTDTLLRSCWLFTHMFAHCVILWLRCCVDCT